MSRLRVHLYMPCWNEETILPHLFRHYSWVERFVVCDNGSTDRTRAIVAAEPRAELRAFDTRGEIDERAYVALKNSVWKDSRGAADFVIVCDADEFLDHPEIERLLAAMKRSGGTVLKPAGYDMVAARPPDPADDLLRTVTSGVRRYEFDKCVLFDPDAIDEISYGIGGHTCTPTGRVRFFGRPGLTLLHYKCLGLDYLRRRFEAAAPRLSAYNHEANLGLGYVESREETIARLQRMAARAEPAVPPQGTPPRLEEDEPGDLDETRRAAMRHHAAGEWRAAHAAYVRVLAYRPGDAEALGNLALVLIRLSLEGEAVSCFRQALALAPTRYDIWFNYGNALLRAGTLDLAERTLREAVRLQPGFAVAWRQLAKARAALGDAAGAAAARQAAEALQRATGRARGAAR